MQKLLRNFLISLFIIFSLIIIFKLLHFNILEYLKDRKEKGQIKDKLNNPLYDVFKTPNKIPPKLKNLLKKIGDYKIINMKVCRVPLTKAIRFLNDATEQHEFEERYKKLGYDDIFHLYLLLEVEDESGASQFYQLEKNILVDLERIKRPFFFEGDCKVVDLVNQVTISQLLEMGKENLEEFRPCEKFWVYDPIYNNCQQFISNLLEAQGLLTADLEYFIDQDVPGLVQKFPIIRCFTDLGKKFTDITCCLLHAKQKNKKSKEFIL